MGTLYKRKWKDPKTRELVEGNTLWIKYYRTGKPYSTLRLDGFYEAEASS